MRTIANNKRAYHDYSIEDSYEAGIVLTGTEVKSLRAKGCNITNSHAIESGGEIILLNTHIAEYAQGNRSNHPPKRPRKLLLHKKQINKLMGLMQTKGYTIVPLSIYFNKRNKIKVSIGIAKGKKKYDKREDMKQKDWERQKQRTLKAEREA